MKMVSKLALGVALTIGMTATATMTPAFAQKKEAAASEWSPKLGNKFRKPAAEVQKALAAKDFATAQTNLAAAAAAAESPDEKYVVGQFRLSIAQETKDQAMQRQAVSEMVASGAGPADMKSKLQFYAGQFAYQANDFPAAIQALTAAEQAGYQGTDVQLLLAESYFKSNQIPAGLQAVERAIAVETAAGRKAPQDWYARAASVAYKAKDGPQVAKWTRMQVEQYPTAENWRSALVIYRDGSNLDTQTNLDLLRLMRASKSLTSERDYYEYAEATSRGLPGETKAVIDEGVAAGALKPASPGIKEMLSSANAQIKEDRAGLASAEKSAAGGANGRVASGTGDAYLGYGDYAKAAAMYRLALQKGGVDANQINTRLGIALARGGQKAEAITAFETVTGPRAELAKFWVLWLNQQA